MKDFSTFLMGAIIGAIVGAAAGLLMTPMRGEDLRGEIEAQVNAVVSDVRSDVNRSLEDMRAMLDERVNTLQHKSAGLEQRVKETLPPAS
jgi:gas vesicle protein